LKSPKIQEIKGADEGEVEIEDREMEDGLLAQGGMGQELGQRWRVRRDKERRRGLLEVLGLFGLVVFLVGVVVVCLRMGGKRKGGEKHGRGVVTVMGEMELGAR
jgi:hypothetical protein